MLMVAAHVQTAYSLDNMIIDVMRAGVSFGDIWHLHAGVSKYIGEND